VNPQLLIALAIAAASLLGGFGSAWKIQSWRYGAKENARAQQQLADERLAAKTAVRRIDNVIEAQSASVVRERDLRAAAAGSRSALVGLHDAAASALRAASASQSACTNRAAAISVVLDQCGAAYQELGAIADRHASDVKTLTDAWPR
jgi:threonine dehydrogenase-like Zn-dependent dehydrogenase